MNRTGFVGGLNPREDQRPWLDQHRRPLRERQDAGRGGNGQEQHDLLHSLRDDSREQSQEILDRHEKVNLVPMLIMTDSLDDNVLPKFQKKFAASYKAAGGDIQFELFEGAEHNWVEKEDR